VDSILMAVEIGFLRTIAGKSKRERTRKKK
jgi:hypothetical protein